MLVALLCGVSFVAPVRAAEGDTVVEPEAQQRRPTVSELNEEGARLYEKRDYRRAIELFVQAYAIDRDPNLLFNLARCYEELGDSEAAIEKYEEFIAAPGADAEGRARAQASLRALRQLESARAAEPVAVSPPSQPMPQPMPQPLVESPPRPSDQPSVLPWVTLGGGVVMVALGATFYALGASDHNRVEEDGAFGDPGAVSTLTRRQAEDLVSSGDTKKLVGGVSLGMGGALLATTVVLLATGSSSDVDAGPIAFSMSPTATGATLSLRGSF